MRKKIPDASGGQPHAAPFSPLCGGLKIASPTIEAILELSR